MIPIHEQLPGICPFCGRQMDDICICGAYYVEEHQQDMSMKEIYGNDKVKDIKKINKLIGEEK